MENQTPEEIKDGASDTHPKASEEVQLKVETVTPDTEKENPQKDQNEGDEAENAESADK
jgi:hypothetical protein